ncbi:hypothetical protein GDO81_027341 [Engystomops pustulosus]|uniref:TMEM248/TMEM219 domain-containing protein n=1 Tax=Engystomops pustulosus TaxID=76066 RepID=A0AAV6YQD4_ENGPU|nr:hypothetical protein GDO81_027341 [Engystomops pustulosus]
MSCQFCGGLRLCVRHHPPLVTFWLCLLMLAATFLFYAFYIRAFPVNDADYTKDFDTVLQTLSASKLCPRWNATAAVPSLQSSEDVANASVLASVTLPSSVNHSALQIRATARQLGMTGPSSRC